jgi:2',3'-cyclic-nucleotide 2'-phosphodiesterase (5'-nucleotidase family)
MYTNDIEGGLSPSEAWWMDPYFPPPIGNAPAAATVIRQKRAEADSLGYGFLLFDSGDIFMGSPTGEFSKGEAVIDFFNYCGYDVASPGNHDYDMGVDVFRHFVENTTAIFLGSNIVYEDTRQVVEYLQPYTTLETNGITIGVFSLLTEYMEGMTTPEKFKNHDVLPEIETAARMVDTLQRKNVDLIFALTGIGLRHDKRMASAVPGIDVIFGSHSASALEYPYEDSIHHTIICQSYSHLTCVGFLELSIDTVTNRIAGYRGELIDLLSDEFEADTAMEAIVARWEKETQKGFDEVIGYNNRELTRAGFEESTVGNLITDAMRDYFDVDIALHNSGGIRANLPQGEVTYRECYNIDALSNTAVILTMTGEVLQEVMEVGFNGHHAIFQVSGLSLEWDPKREIGARIQKLTDAHGESIDPQREYSVVTNSYLAAGGGEYIVFKNATEEQETFTYLRNILADYIKTHSPIDMEIEGRIINLQDR